MIYGLFMVFEAEQHLGLKQDLYDHLLLEIALQSLSLSINQLWNYLILNVETILKKLEVITTSVYLLKPCIT